MAPSLARLQPHPDAPPPGTALAAHHPGCFGCGELEGGLRLQFTTGPDLTVHGRFTVGVHHQGSPGLIHGGVLAAVLDEALGALQVYVREPMVTASLTTDFRRPVPVGTELHLQARYDRRAGRKLHLSGEGRLDAPDGPIAGRATALFLVVSPEHYTRLGIDYLRTWPQ